MSSNIELLNQSNIFHDFKKDIDFFRDQIEKKEKGESISINIEAYEKALYDGIIGLENNIIDPNDKKIFLEIKSILLDKERQISAEQLKKLGEILISLEDSELEKTDLESLRNSVETIKSLKGELNKLRTNINLISDTKVKEVKQKIEKYNEKLKLFSEKHPIRTKALILLLPANLAVLFKKQNIQAEPGGAMTENSGTLGQIKDIVNKIKGYFSFAMSWMAQIAVMFFNMPFLGAPKEMQELLADMKKDLKNIDTKLLKELGVGMESIIEKLNDNPEVIENNVKFIETKLKKLIPNTIMKLSGKNISDQDLDKVIKKINVKELFEKDTKEMEKLVKYFKEGTHNDANYLKAGVEGVVLPFKLFFRIFSVLKEENYVSYTDLGVNFLKKTGDIFLGTFGLMESGVSYLSGKIDEEKFTQNLKDMFIESPETTKELLAIMLYRHGGIVFSTLGEISNYLGKLIIYSLSGESSFKSTIISGLKGNIDEYVRVLGKLNEIVPTDLKFDGIGILRKTINELEEANNIVKVLLDNKGKQLTGLQFIEEYKKQFGKSPTLLGNMDNIGSNELRSVISGAISKLGEGLDKQIGVLESKIGKTFKGIVSSSALLDDLSKQVKNISSYLSDVVRTDKIFNKIRSQFKKIGLTANIMEIDPLYDKLVFTFQSPTNAKEFFSNLTKLAKQSPELLRFIFDKTPIFLVAGLSAANNDTLEEFGKQLMYLVPFFGSGYMLMDSMYAGRENLLQATTSVILLGTETGYITYQLGVHGFKDGGKRVLDYIIKPGKDVLEIAGFLSRIGFTTLKVSSDTFKLITNGKFDFSEFKNLFSKFPKLKSKPVGWILFGILFLGYEFVFADSTEFKQITEKCKKNGKFDISCLDEKIKSEWNNLSNDEKAEFIAIAYGFRSGKLKGLEGKYDNGKYKIILTEKYGAIPNNYRKREIINSIKYVLSKYGSVDLPIEVYFKESLLEKIYENNEIKTPYQKKKYFESLGYPDNFIKKVIHI